MKNVTENRTIQAQYEPLYYAVAYDANGGTGTYSGGTLLRIMPTAR